VKNARLGSQADNRVGQDAILSHDQKDSLKLYVRHDLHEARAAGRGDQAEAKM
jgi:hypothetical protein